MIPLQSPGHTGTHSTGPLSSSSCSDETGRFSSGSYLLLGGGGLGKPLPIGGALLLTGGVVIPDIGGIPAIGGIPGIIGIGPMPGIVGGIIGIGGIPGMPGIIIGCMPGIMGGIIIGMGGPAAAAMAAMAAMNCGGGILAISGMPGMGPIIPGIMPSMPGIIPGIPGIMPGMPAGPGDTPAPGTLNGAEGPAAAGGPFSPSRATLNLMALPCKKCCRSPTAGGAAARTASVPCTGVPAPASMAAAAGGLMAGWRLWACGLGDLPGRLGEGDSVINLSTASFKAAPSGSMLDIAGKAVEKTPNAFSASSDHTLCDGAEAATMSKAAMSIVEGWVVPLDCWGVDRWPSWAEALAVPCSLPVSL
mmetsp:Transcript_111853/g.194190  ORF Transcript_111853/g.194190 Transcript_111853/m.194190 type:complete len:361 (+) Transcript_111853:1161-2243(+)